MNLNISRSFSKSFLAFFLFSLLNSMCGFNISFGSIFIALCIFLNLTHVSGKIVKFWYGLHTYFYHLSSISFFGFSSFGSLLPLICLCISTCLSDSIFALTFLLPVLMGNHYANHVVPLDILHPLLECNPCFHFYSLLCLLLLFYHPILNFYIVILKHT